MDINRRWKRRVVWATISLSIVLAGGAALGFQFSSSPSPSSTVFTTAHSSLGAAIREFFDIRSTPVQPIAYTHTVHVLKNSMPCVQCHVGVDKGPLATIPNVKDCMGCHEYVKADNPAGQKEIDKIKAYQDKGEQIPWQRVYGYPAISHVRFNHEPHIRNKIECAKCHGDIPHMTTAQRVVNQSMGFCLQCHDGKKAPSDCMTCHY